MRVFVFLLTDHLWSQAARADDRAGCQEPHAFSVAAPARGRRRREAVGTAGAKQNTVFKKFRERDRASPEPLQATDILQL